MSDHTLPLFSLQSETKEIPLSQGRVALVDASDFDWLMQWKWYCYKSHHTWYARRNARRVGGRQFSVHMHRMILDASSSELVDHKDGNGLNNTRLNIRICTPAQNCYNQTVVGRSASGYKGVTWHKRTQKWRAQIRFDSKFRHLGLFDDPREAAIAYDIAARQLFGEFAHTNF